MIPAKFRIKNILQLRQIQEEMSFFSSKSNSKGDASSYTGKLYFDPEADTSQGRDYFITDGELRDKLVELVDDSENIVQVRYYTHPLNSWQMSKFVLHHAFIVFETNKWWWSIEKNDAGVTLQRSKDIEYVRDKYRRTKRTTGIFTGITLEKEARGSTTLNELINHIYSRNYLNQDYHFLDNNCQHFAEKIYQFI